MRGHSAERRAANQVRLGAVIAAAGVMDAIIFPFGIMNEASGLYWDWPKELNATLPETGKGTALMRTVR